MAESGQLKKKKDTASKLPDEESDIVYPISYHFGKPTLYRDSYCQKLIEWGAQGKTMAFLCTQFNIDRDTFSNWLNERPEFKNAYEISKMSSQNYYEQLALDHLIEGKDEPKMNNGHFKTLMAANFKEDYGIQLSALDVKDVSNEGSDKLDDFVELLEEKLRNSNDDPKK